MLGRLFFRMISGMLAFAVAQLFVGLAVLVRLLPGLVVGVRVVFQISLILSFRLYHLILKQFAPRAKRYGLEITSGLGRIAATTGLSLVFGTGLWLLIGWHLSWLIVGLLVIHGLLVGLAWDEIEKPGGLQMGAKIE